MDKPVSSSDLSFLSADCRDHRAHLIPDTVNSNNNKKQQQQPAQTKREAPPTQQPGPPAKQQVGTIFTENTSVNFVLNDSVAEEEADEVCAGTGTKAIKENHVALRSERAHRHPTDQ
ncbi:hypothetical protein CF326_g9480 [Tilletia indica]|nr:hypothetical protein CF326_g9480 [Tilletia indica]